MGLSEEDIIKALRNLSRKIRKEIEEGISQGILQPEEGIYSRLKINEFEYSEGGVTKYSASGENITKKLGSRHLAWLLTLLGNPMNILLL